MKIKIHVTKEILEKTKRCNFKIDTCAISEAVRDIFPQAYVVYSTMYPFPISYQDVGDESINMPHEAVQFQRYFDTRKSDDERAAINPISFEIDVPDSVIEKIGIDQVHAILKESKTLSLA